MRGCDLHSRCRLEIHPTSLDLCRLTANSTFKVGLMYRIRYSFGLVGDGRIEVHFLFVILLLLFVGCQRLSIAEQPPAEPTNVAVTPAKPNAQLQLYRQALTSKGSSDQMRTNAAFLLLSSPDPQAHKILLEVLSQSQNAPARLAVCKALSKASLEQDSIEKGQDFIAPLVQILRTTEDPSLAKLAAEAMLLFNYEQISKPLHKLLTDPSASPKARLNAVYTLQLQPDKRAVLELLDLVNDPDVHVAAAARKAVESMGRPVGADPNSLERVRIELQRQDEKDFLRKLAIRWVTETRNLEDELQWWKKQYLDALDRAYAAINDDQTRSKFLAQHLKSSKQILRLWALEKVNESRLGGASQLPAELGPILEDLISDPDSQVRLKTAKLLSLMPELNSAEKLLKQLSIETDQEVRLETFVALGVAVYYGLLPNPPERVSPKLVNQTLQYARDYLFGQDQRGVLEGAEVIRKLLERNGVPEAQVKQYLGLLLERYEQENGKANGLLRGELLAKMAGLCVEASSCRSEAIELYSAIFEEALTDKTASVREAAVDGLINIGKVQALARFRGSDLLSDPNPAIRKELIALAATVGGPKDLTWLWQKVGSGAEEDLAWEAMVKIFRRSDLSVLREWLTKLDQPDNRSRLSEEKRLLFLEIAEQKALGENDLPMLKVIWTRLAGLYRKAGKYEQAADYLGKLHEAMASAGEKAAILPDLLDVYLRWQKVDQAAELVNNCLLSKDLDPNSPVALTIEQYLNSPPAGADPNEVLKALIARIGPVEGRPKWQKLLERWNERLGKTGKVDQKPGKTG